MRARGLKRHSASPTQKSQKSRPMRARGLKQPIFRCKCFPSTSRPMRARGLKQHLIAPTNKKRPVAPHAGAWIETPTQRTNMAPLPSRPMRARGLKPEGYGALKERYPSRPMRARGLKQHEPVKEAKPAPGRAPCGRVD